MHYDEKTFDLPDLNGISDKQVEAHLKLYSGYVKHTNYILEQLNELAKDPEKNKYELSELRRRLGFEWNGMRNHEYYFTDIQGGAKELADDSQLATAIESQFGSLKNWETEFKQIAGSVRGDGWTFLMYDRDSAQLVNTWVSEHDQGQTTMQPIVTLDMWEHAYMVDYLPSEKGGYIDSYMENLNWKTIADRFKTVA